MLKCYDPDDGLVTFQKLKSQEMSSRRGPRGLRSQAHGCPDEGPEAPGRGSACLKGWAEGCHRRGEL